MGGKILPKGYLINRAYLEKLTIKQLKELAKDRGTKIPTTPKAKIIDALLGSTTPKKTTPKKTPKKTKTLYDRLGGIFGISLVVNHFSDALIENPLVGRDSPNKQLKTWSRNKLDRLPGLKWLRTLWLADLAGGPYKFVPTKPGKCPFGLEKAHSTFKISSEEFDEVARELANSLDHFKIPEKEKGEVLSVFAAHKLEVAGGKPGKCPVKH
jgi:hemoglobin